MSLPEQAVTIEQYEGSRWHDVVNPDTSREEYFWLHWGTLAESWHGKEVIDIGAGTGWLAVRIAGAGARRTVAIEPGIPHRILGIDGHSVELIPTTLQDYDPDQQFDVATLNLVLPYFKDPEETFERLARLLRPSGEIQALVPPFTEQPRMNEVERTWLSEDEYVATFAEEGRSPIAAFIRTPERYIEAAQSAGFQLLSNEGVLPAVGPPGEGYVAVRFLRFRKD